MNAPLKHASGVAKPHAELLGRLDRLIERFPDIRLGQLICNLTLMAGKTDPGAMWDIEDEELLDAAEELLAQQAEFSTLAESSHK